MERRGVYAICILAVLILLIACVWHLRNRAAEAAEISARDLCKTFLHGTDADREKLTGRFVLVAGKVRNVNSTGERSFVLLDGGGNGAGVRAYFEGARSASLAEVQAGSQVKISGQIRGLSSGAVVLEDCRLGP